MFLLFQRHLPLFALQAVRAQSNSQSDPLISKGGDIALYVGLFLLIIAIGCVIGIISRRLEYALLFALTLSAVFIVFLWTL